MRSEVGVETKVQGQLKCYYVRTEGRLRYNLGKTQCRHETKQMMVKRMAGVVVIYVEGS